MEIKVDGITFLFHFGVQILTEYKHEDIPLVLEACERMHAHLTAAVVSNDLLFLQVRTPTKCLGLIGHVSTKIQFPRNLKGVPRNCMSNHMITYGAF